MFAGSGLGSITAGLFGLMGGRRDDDPVTPLRNFQAMLDAVQDAQSVEDLDRLERDADEVFRATYAHGIKNELSAAGIASFDMAMREFRSRVAARRSALAG
jgi:predicted lipid-binding transport protein (Tim44 family)